MSSDHLVFAPDSLIHVLTPPFSSLLRHGFVPSMCVSWNGFQSEQFQVSRGVRQGGILSPILFALYISGTV